MSNEVKIKIADSVFEDYKKTADKWNPVLSELPIAAAQDVLQYMTGIKGLRGKHRFGYVSGKSQFGPYNPDRKSAAIVDIDYRDIETHMGSVIEVFHPNDYAMLTMGYNSPTLGDGQKRASQTLLVLSQLAKARGEALSYAVFNGVRNAQGNETKDLFDGFNTILDKEIEAGNVSEAKNNLVEVTDVVTDLNAYDIATEIVTSRNSYQRRIERYLLCSYEFADAYNRAYLTTHPAVPYNKQYEHRVLEGSEGKVTLVPLAQLSGSDTFYLTPKSNLLWGTDNDSDQTFTQVDRFEPFRLTLSATMWFGVQFHTLDPRVFTAIKLNPTSEEPAPEDPEEVDPDKDKELNGGEVLGGE